MTRLSLINCGFTLFWGDTPNGTPLPDGKPLCQVSGLSGCGIGGGERSGVISIGAVRTYHGSLTCPPQRRWSAGGWGWRLDAFGQCMSGQPKAGWPTTNNGPCFGTRRRAWPRWRQGLMPSVVAQTPTGSNGWRGRRPSSGTGPRSIKGR